MKRKVRIVTKPKAQSGLEVKMNAGLYGTNGNRQFTLPNQIESSRFSEPGIDVNSTLKPVPREMANIEAEKGEIIMTDMTGDGIPETYKVGGERHFKGGTPLNVPKDSFVFSDTNKMKIKDPSILEMFGKGGKTRGGFTPADLAAKYDINEYRKILADPNSDKLQRSTAEAMITNYNLKLAKLSLVQESMKGFPQGIPTVAMPYLMTMNMDPAAFIPTQAQPDMQDANMGVAKYGGIMKAQFGKDIPGFSGNMTKAAKFASDPSTKDAFAAYYDALSSKDPSKMLRTADVLEQTDIPNSLGFLPWSDQDKLQDMAAILREKTGMHSTGSANKQLQKAAAKKAEDVYNALYIKEQNAKTPLEKLQIKGLREKLSTYHPLYRNVEDFDQTFYSASELEEIEKLYKANPLPSVSKAPAKTLPNKTKEDVMAKFKPVPGAPSVDTYFPDPASVTSEEERAKLERLWEITHPTYKKQFGGGLPLFQEAGANPFAKKTKQPAKPYASKTVAGRTTPTGLISDNPYSSIEEWQEARKRRGLTHLEHNSAASQEEAYDIADPYWKAMMWGTYGDTAKGGSKQKFSKWAPKKDAKGHISESFEDYKSRLQAEGLDPDKIKSETDKLKSSFVDEKSGIREAFLLQQPAQKKPEAKQPAAPIVKDPEVTPEEPLTLNHLAPVPQEDYAPWWLQDVVKTAGAAGDFFRVKKYQPWQATPGTYLPTPTFYDPSRELAANAEQANIQTQGLAQFAGPQALSARSSAIQGSAAKNAADIMARYNTMNVGTANDFEVRNAAILNDAARQKAALDTQLFDKYTIVNQQFDNARNMARQNLRQSYIDALTNRANTYNLNQMYPQFAVDPNRAGMIYGHNFREMVPGKEQGDPVASLYDTYAEKYGSDKAMEMLKLRFSGKGA